MLTIENNKMHNRIVSLETHRYYFLDYWHYTLSANVSYLKNLFLYENILLLILSLDISDLYSLHQLITLNLCYTVSAQSTKGLLMN